MSHAHNSHLLHQSAVARRAESAVAQTERRPVGLSMLAVAAATIGVAALVQAGAWLGASDIAVGSRLAAVAGVISLMLGIVAVVEFIFAYGVVELRGWATRLGATATIAALVLTLLSAGRGSSAAHTLSLLLEIWTVWYLLSPRVQEAFRSHARRDV